MSREEINQQIADFLKKGGKIQQIERGLSSTDLVGGKFNETALNRTKRGGYGITIKRWRQWHD